MRRDEIQAVYEQGLNAFVEFVERLFSIIETQQSELEVLKTQVKELQERLSTNSSNSDKPPSSDGFNKQTQSLRKKSRKKRGGQKGHQGSRLDLSEKPDSIQLHCVTRCSSCGSGLEEVEGEVLSERRQVYDLPSLKLFVTEHRVVKKKCKCCGKSVVGEFPANVQERASYGEGVKGFLVYLHKGQLLPIGRSCQIVEDLFSHTVSAGSLHNFTRECSEELEEIHALIKDGIIKTKVVNFDETGMRVCNKLGWLHTASTEELTYYAFDTKRGRVAIERIGILPQFNGVACHDSYKSYLSYSCNHSLCNAHHLRELTFLAEVQNRDWAASMKRLLLNVKRSVERAKAKGETELSKGVQTRFENSYKAIVGQGHRHEQQMPVPIEVAGKRGRKKQSKAKNLLDRLEKYMDETLRFMRDFSVPFDNNLAERDLRMMKVQQKVSGCFRTDEGAEDFCRIRSYISTMKKQGHNLLESLRSVFAGKPFVPDTG
jgi:transposase